MIGMRTGHTVVAVQALTRGEIRTIERQYGGTVYEVRTRYGTLIHSCDTLRKARMAANRMGIA